MSVSTKDLIPLKAQAEAGASWYNTTGDPLNIPSSVKEMLDQQDEFNRLLYDRALGTSSQIIHIPTMEELGLKSHKPKSKHAVEIIAEL